MSKKTGGGENPLLSKNIPPPPKEQNGITVKGDKGKTIPGQSDNMVSGQNASLSRNSMPEEEKATIEVSLYLRPAQDDKLEDLRRAYKHKTRKKISANELIRRLIERATLDDIL